MIHIPTFGTGKGFVKLGDPVDFQCETCESEQSYQLYLSYRYWHVMHFFAWLDRKGYEYECARCKNRFPANAEDAKQMYPRHTVPWIHQWSWILLPSMLASYWVLQLLPVALDALRRWAAH